MWLPGVAVPAEARRLGTGAVDARGTREDQKTGAHSSGKGRENWKHHNQTSSTHLPHLIPAPPQPSPQYPPGYLAAMANKTKKEACARPGRGGRSKHYSGRGRPRGGRRRKLKEREENGGEEEEMEGEGLGEREEADEKQPLLPCVVEKEAERTEERKTSRGSGGEQLLTC